ncbi:MFS transporter [Thermoplasmatales archaeon AK]|nr:MFS transporter [Thermoplasmatales archaeon AK]
MSTNNNAGSALADLTARIDRLTVRPYPRMWMVILGIGYFFAFYDILSLSYTFVSPMVVQLHMTEVLLSLSASLTLFGYIVGTYVVSTISDYLGRRLGLITNALFVAIGTLISAASYNAAELLVGRFITGMGIGAEISIMNTYMSEITPAPIRGRMTQWAYVSGALGFALTPFIALVLIPVNTDGWRYLFAIPAIIAVAIVFVRFSMPETPRWLLMKGREDEAQEVVKEMELFAERKIGKLPEIPKYMPEMPLDHFPTREILSRKYGARLAVVATFWFLDYTLAYGFLGFAPLIFVTSGFLFTSAVWYIGLGSFGYIIGAVSMAFIADRWERKFLVISAIIPAIISVFLFAWALIIHSADLITVGAFLASFATAFAVPAYTYTAEIFPTRARATGFALSDGIGHFGGAIAPFIFSAVVVLSASEIVATGSRFFIILGVAEIVAALVLTAGPRSTKLRLESLSP